MHCWTSQQWHPPSTIVPQNQKLTEHYKVPPEDLNYATVHKTREKGRVVKIDFRAIFGTAATVMAALAPQL